MDIILYVVFGVGLAVMGYRVITKKPKKPVVTHPQTGGDTGTGTDGDGGKTPSVDTFM